MVVGQLDSHLEKDKHYIHTSHYIPKVNFKWIRELNGKNKTTPNIRRKENISKFLQNQFRKEFQSMIQDPCAKQ